MNNNLVDRLFRDNTGEIVIAQAPNIPILLWISATLLKLVFKTGKVKIALDLLAFGSILYWSFLEITQGATYFRRDLGVIVLIAIVTSVIQQFGKTPDITTASNRATSS
ncbi:hypothetical protein [Chamaesiphon sp.]|uniref:hypothetical protein n=1 Tax=Chamaesiphon sp. TaxID=2814140 RepID=UPI0035938788